jgi:hypothetical protein
MMDVVDHEMVHTFTDATQSIISSEIEILGTIVMHFIRIKFTVDPN